MEGTKGTLSNIIISIARLPRALALALLGLGPSGAASRASDYAAGPGAGTKPALLASKHHAYMSAQRLRLSRSSPTFVLIIRIWRSKVQWKLKHITHLHHINHSRKSLRITSAHLQQNAALEQVCKGVKKSQLDFDVNSGSTGYVFGH